MCFFSNFIFLPGQDTSLYHFLLNMSSSIQNHFFFFLWCVTLVKASYSSGLRCSWAHKFSNDLVIPLVENRKTDDSVTQITPNMH